jgi:RHS repeat-associated protein
MVDYDANGNVLGLVDSLGNAASTYEYGPFGEVVRASGPMAALNPFQFSTKYTDAETGLNYYGLRYYEPSTGRWLSRDPIEEQGGLNLYAFVANNGVNQFDPFGLMTENDITNVVLALDATLKNSQCCCNKNESPKVDLSISGSPSGSSVTNTATPTKHGCVVIVGYYWWNCVSAQSEAKGANGGKLPPQTTWQDYGWSPGGVTVTAQHGGFTLGLLNLIPGVDSSGWEQWNWQAIVVYTYCAGGRWHASYKSSNQLLYNWNGYGPWGHWGSPTGMP